MSGLQMAWLERRPDGDGALIDGVETRYESCQFDAPTGWIPKLETEGLFDKPISHAHGQESITGLRWDQLATQLQNFVTFICT
jgi:hypothetical protein